jgi:transposase
LTLVYQIDLGMTRLLWVGKERTIESFQGFFKTMGDEIVSKIVFVCSDMWEPYLNVIREKCSEALHILDRFHIVAKMNKALDEVRSRKPAACSAKGALRSYGSPADYSSNATRISATTSTSDCAISSATT